MGIYLKDIIEGTCRKSVQDENGKNISDTYLKKTGDSKDNTASFTSADSLTPAAWADVPVLATGEKHSSILNKISTMFRNIRWLYKMLGTTNIASIGGGTLTGAVSKLNTDINAVSVYAIPQPQTDNVFTGFKYWYARIYKIGRVVTMTVSLQGAMESSGFHKLFTIPETYHPIEQVIGSYPTMGTRNDMSFRLIQDGSFELGNSGTKIENDWICRLTVTYIT